MVTDLKGDVLKQFLASANSTTCFSKRSVKMSGIDLDAMHRKFRIMVKKGYMDVREDQNLFYYSISSKGKRLLPYLSHKNK